MFRANPEAFGGNINVLRSGAILRIPGPESVADVGAGEAASEIGRQTAAWRAGTASEEPARLRLVTPSEAGTAAPAAPSGSADPQARIAELGREIEESRRLLELRSAELAQLQRQVEEQAAAQAAAAAPAAEPEAEVPAAPEAAAPEAATPPAPVAETAPAPAAEAPAPAAAPAAPETSFVDTLTDNWQYVLGGAALLLGGVFAVGYLRRRREEDFDESIRSFEPPAAAPVPSETRRLRALKMPAAGGMVVGTTTEDQELEDFRTATIPPSGRKAEDHGVSFDDTLSSEESADLDKGDPLAEADFHMAYGLYDQAADIVKQGLEKEPGRRDYEIKLLEIYFVSGDKENFLASARRFDASRDDGDGADWDRVLIMGHQLAPDDPLFEGGAPRGGVDLNLEGGDSRVDLELLSPPGEEGVDLDLGQALQAADSEADTGESKALDIDLDIDDTGLIRTAEMERLRDQTAEMPTVEMPRAHGQGDSPTMEATRLQPAPGTEATVEMAMDDLGIDIGDVDAVSEDDVTQLLPAADDLSGLADAAGEMDFDLTEAASGEPPADEGAETQILDIGGAIEESIESTGAAGRISLDELPQMSELEPVTMSEVGTKLDLAQAYVDMGDPDGARSILEEVLKEGSASQKQEARRLLDSLPGA
jgi:pilus assembly protein FimV